MGLQHFQNLHIFPCEIPESIHLSFPYFVALGGPGGLSRGEMSLAEVQCHLDKEGASDLVIDLIMNTTSDRVFQESILLAIALLEGGNTTIQVSLTKLLWVLAQTLIRPCLIF